MLYETTALARRKENNAVSYDELGAECLALLRLDGVEVEDVLLQDGGEAFESGLATLVATNSIHRLDLLVYIGVRDLGRHVELHPEEADLDRDWDHLGEFSAGISARYRRGSGEVRLYLLTSSC